MNYISRKLSPFIKKDNSVFLEGYKKFPVYMGCTNDPLSQDLKEDMNWYIDKSSGFIYLNPLLPLDVVYAKSHGSGSTGRIWNEHHLEFSNFISKFNPKTVLEIGGGHGQLAQNYLNISPGVDWTIIEPNPSISDSLNVTLIQGFFDENFDTKKPYDTVVHSHVLEHLYDYDSFVSHKSNILRDGDHLIFSVPNMEEMLKRNYTNCLNFEHPGWITEPYIENLLSRFQFKIIEKQYFKNNHSIFYAAKKDLSIKEIPLSKDLFTKNKRIFGSFIDNIKSQATSINAIIKTSDKSSIFLFGAHIFSQYLINFGLDETKINNIIDNDSAKHEKRLYGTDLICKSPHVLEEVDKPVVILKAGVYNNEIKADILSNINCETVFI